MKIFSKLLFKLNVSFEENKFHIKKEWFCIILKYYIDNRKIIKDTWHSKLKYFFEV